MASTNSMYCPKCGNKLAILKDGNRYCGKCKTQYVVTPRTVTPVKQEDKSSGFIVFLIILLILLLGAAAGFLIYHFFFSHYDYDKYYEKEYAPYYAGLSEQAPALVSADEAVDLDVQEGEPIQVLGVVEETDDNLIGLNNGVDCYIIPDILDGADAAKMQDVLGRLEPGDVVGIPGMVCGTSPLTLKYCNVPYIYYDGLKYYNEYEGYRNGVMYPDISYHDDDYNRYVGLVNGGDVLYQTAPDVLNAFRTGGTVTEDSFNYGADFYRDTALNISGTVIEVTNYYICIENIYCFFCWEVLSEEQISYINTVEINDYVTVSGLVTNPSLDAFRMNYCHVDDVIKSEKPISSEETPDEETIDDDTVSNEDGVISAALYAVLTGEEGFINYGYGNIEEYQHCDMISDGEQSYNTRSFAIIDIGGDGTNEVVLCSDGTVDSAYTVLYEYNGNVYGTIIGGGRSVQMLQTNGLFYGSGGASSGYVQGCELNGSRCEVIIEAMIDEEYSSYGYGADTYTIRDEEVTKEECQDYLNQIGWKDDGNTEAEFYDYTDANILSLLTS